MPIKKGAIWYEEMITGLGDEVHGELKILSALEGKSMLQIITKCIEECFERLAEEASKKLQNC